jgi:hypothetical protein
MMLFLKNIFTTLLRIHPSFFTYFSFSNILNPWTIKSPILKFGGGWIHQISVKFTEFVNKFIHGDGDLFDSEADLNHYREAFEATQEPESMIWGRYERVV